MSALRPPGRCRVLTALEVALATADERDALDDPEAVAQLLATDLTLLGIRPKPAAGAGVDLIELVEAETYRRDLERRGRDALDEDLVPAGVPRDRVLEAERDAAYARVLDAVDRLAVRLPAGDHL